MDESDLNLINRVSQNDESAFDELVKQYKKKIYFLAYRFVRNHDDAADIAQETFIKVYQSIGKLKQKGSFRTWLYRITVNLSINHLRKYSKQNKLEIDKIQTQNTNTSELKDPVEAKELQKKISQAINRLPQKQKTTVILRTYQELSYKEIAEVMKCSEGTVKANYFQAVQKLKNKFEDYR